MNPNIGQEINLLKGFLDQAADCGIVIGAHQNLDTVASALSLYLALSQSGKKVQIISKKEPTVEVSGLVGIDKVRENFIGNTGKLVVSLPYIKGEVEKVLFTEAPNTINFHLTAAPDRSITPFDLSDVKLIWEGGAPANIITIGVGTIDELAGIVDANATKIANIDNYAANSRFGDVVIVDESLSSLSEIVGKIIKDMALPMDRDIAQNILDGVLFATRNFTKQNTSPLAFEAASSAMYVGAQRKVEEQPQERRDSFQNSPRPQVQNSNRDQRQERGRNDNRQQQNRQSRVSDTDFPAMHMQQPRQNQGQNQPQNQPIIDNRRMNNPTRGVQNQNPQRPSQQFGQDRPQQQQQQPRPRQDFSQNTDVDALMEKIKAENAKYAPDSYQDPIQNPIQDAQIVSDPMSTAPIEDTQMPEDQSYNAPTSDEVPDDWLMPKVFKSSKNNN